MGSDIFVHDQLLAVRHGHREKRDLLEDAVLASYTELAGTDLAGCRFSEVTFPRIAGEFLFRKVRECLHEPRLPCRDVIQCIAKELGEPWAQVDIATGRVDDGNGMGVCGSYPAEAFLALFE